MHSQRMNETALQPWVIVSTNGRVEAAHCTCMAGVAETCTHVAALLGKRRRSQKRHIPIATLEDLPPLLDTLQKHSKAVTLCGVENYYTNYTTQSPTLPQSLACLHNRDAESLGLPDLQVHCLKFLTAAGVTEAQAEEIEAQTRSQHMTPAWFRWRAGRITASAMHAVLATSLDTPAHSVVNRVCYPEKTFSTVQTRWGVEHEEDARKAYKEIMASHHRNLQVRLCGFCVNNFPEVGASPDGLTICDCCGKGCLEIKCPFKQRMASIKEALAAQDKDFCLEVAANGLQLKQAHPYYCQVQTQIFVTGANHCDLVVWTQRDLAVIRIFPAVDFWKPRLKQAQDFFLKVCLPELVGKYFSKQRAALSSL
uniref:SWIM-type domain-containing protein n=1 Tax=Oreochromis niloticus TaxID=8128 RepID=A0A669BUI7_ORENI